MIEENFFPFSFDVAAFALRAEVTFVRVIFFMTRETIHRQLFFQVNLVTTAAFGSQMLAYQWIFGFFGMVEQNFFPSFFKVAAITFRAETTFMFVIFFMTRYTASLQFFLVQISLMAAGAFEFMMFKEQGILCLFCMVEQNVFPALFYVTRFAFRAEITFVLVILFMT